MDVDDIIGLEQADDILSTIIRYGIFAGAIFQLACLLSCFFIDDENNKQEKFVVKYHLRI